MKNVLTALVALGAVWVIGCEDKPAQVTPEPPKPPTTAEQTKPAATAEQPKPAPANAGPVETAKPASTGGW